MTRNNKREIRHKIESLTSDAGHGEAPPVVALEKEDGGYIAPDGGEVEDPEQICLTLPPMVWQEWGEL